VTAFLGSLINASNGLATISFSKSLELGIGCGIREEAIGAKYETDLKFTSAKL